MFKYESAILIQLRIGKIGLNSFLCRRNIPGIESPLYSCEVACETASHLATNCPMTVLAREKLATCLGYRLRSAKDFAAALDHPVRARKCVRWFLELGRLYEFRVAEEIGGETGETTGQSTRARAKARRIPG